MDRLPVRNVTKKGWRQETRVQGEKKKKKSILFYLDRVWDRLENVYRRMKRYRTKNKLEDKGGKLQRT